MVGRLFSLLKRPPCVSSAHAYFQHKVHLPATLPQVPSRSKRVSSPNHKPCMWSDSRCCRIPRPHTRRPRRVLEAILGTLPCGCASTSTAVGYGARRLRLLRTGKKVQQFTVNHSSYKGKIFPSSLVHFRSLSSSYKYLPSSVKSKWKAQIEYACREVC